MGKKNPNEFNMLAAQRVGVTIPGVSKLGIACEKISSNSGYTHDIP